MHQHPRRQSSRAKKSRVKAPQVTDRSMAVEVVMAFTREDLPLDEALEQHVHRRTNASRDACARAHEISVGTVRHLNLLDEALVRHMGKRLQRKYHYAWAVLRTGLYQAHFMRTPVHAAVDAAVELVKLDPSGQSRTGFVNAVLRRAAETPLEEVWQGGDRVKQLSLQYAHPPWMVDRWVQQIGEEATEARLQAANQKAAITVRVNRLKATPQQWVKAVGRDEIDVEPCPESEESLILPSGVRVHRLPGYDEGWFAVQDRAAQAVARLVDPQPEEKILDACAAPGGKSAHLAALSDGKATITALERSEPRMARMAANFARLGVSNITPLCADAGEPLTERYDRALVDAPCTGTGVIRRHPDIKWRRRREGIADAVKEQQRILAAVGAAIRPGGVMVYATCSLEPEENQMQVEHFLESHPEWQRWPLTWDQTGVLPQWINAQGDLVTEPARDGVDGFYAARLRKKAE
uniref:16S rRNA (cytosine(967)-C(5))-methyltransferase n=1 Tax=Magnetococcus massalia (strain MO-1) TaxID=451514 RepID=A0A1S7LN91_MAGMO|nr:putative ribosomal RNA small subunit methyltransferase B (rsmB) [Candidatus Magnetococcus massalia]